ncbi:adenosylcobyric acid synthase [Clostridium moniliforme]|uniref:Cobyric acid synthase n=1 Tax=Clostridium moniliforme TaxID=39489 RepID=A0ABS4EWV4_9CLOT|nr:cobyric acid synthase [Clostridium moniliforme]MBP1888476.1 adenosylcobyric acid synthase [Clostridium moniliforme]
MKKNIMVLGTASSVGKSTVLTALCRVLKKKGYDVAPFKGINVSLNSTKNKMGEEIAKAQFIQSEACEITPKGIMNPILIKPSSDNKAKIFVNGKSYCNKENCNDDEVNKDLKEFLKEGFEKLSKEYDNIIVEGRGSAFDVNLKCNEMSNFYIANLTNSDVILVGNDEKGGAIPSIYGTVMLLKEEERKLIKGIIINKVKGDINEFKNNISILEEKLNIPVLGVLPYKELTIENEETVTKRLRSNKRSGLNVAIIKFQHISNITDFYPLELEKNVNIRYVKTPNELEGANLIILPGSKSITYDLEYIKSNGLYDKIVELQKNGATVMGICGGFQMLGKNIIDSSSNEEDNKIIKGFNMLPLNTTLSSDKKTAISNGIVCSMKNELKSLSNIRVYGYEVHNGFGEMLDNGEVFIIDKNNNVIGLCNEKGDVFGTYIHGILEGEEFRKNLINDLKKKYNVVIENSKEEKEHYKKYKLEQYDNLGEFFEEHINMDKILEILKNEKEEETKEKSLEE